MITSARPLLLACLLLALAPRGWAVPSLAEIDFERLYDEALCLGRGGRWLEAQAMLRILPGRLGDLPHHSRYQWGARLQRSLRRVGDVAIARDVSDVMASSCLAELAYLGKASGPLPRDPIERGKHLSRLGSLSGLPEALQHTLLVAAVNLLVKVADAPADVELALARALIGLKRPEQARVHLANAVAKDPQNADAHFTLAKVSLDTGDRNTSLAEVSRALSLRLDADGTTLLATLAEDIHAAGDRTRATALCDQFIKPGGPEAALLPLLRLRGRFREASGDLEPALADFLRVARADPQDVRPVGRVARSLSKNKAGRPALLRQLVPVAPAVPATPADLLLLVGELQLQQGNSPGAIAYYAAGLNGSDRPRFEAVLSELRQGTRAKGAVRDAAAIDLALGPPPGPERDKHYLVLEMDGEICTIGAKGTLVGPSPKGAELDRFAGTLGKALAEYPSDLLQHLRAWKVVLTRTPIQPGRLWMGVTDPDKSLITLYIGTNGAAEKDWHRAFHHEIFHLIDAQMRGGLATDRVWARLNPPGFTYTGNKDVPCEPITGSSGPPVEGFLNQYAATSVEEDKAVTFASLMVDSLEADRRANGDAYIRSKLERIQALTKGFLPSMGDDFWGAVRKRARDASVTVTKLAQAGP